MENLKAMSCHYTSIDPKYLEAWKEAHPGSILPPEKIPDELLKNLLDQRSISRLLQCLKEL
jgi:metallopeptidase MepB